MNDDELFRTLDAVGKRANAALGEALVAGILIGPLIEMLIRRGALDRTEGCALIDAALLALERREHPMPEADQPVSRYARSRLESLLKLHSPKPRQTPSV